VFSRAVPWWSRSRCSEKEGKEEASIDSLGAVLGAVAMVGFASVVTLWVTRWAVVTTLAVALVVWPAGAIGLNVIVAAV